ncbi:iron ABC transporter permease [Vannielia litorea]|uniref:FecCD family ABC transporter permease n=1 Tax=Vannielia litorea TaxID=1217970 RepID=UPI001C93CDEC|nr:iron ABC transporter permease [Vannielia litorea]MBY6153777.1 iron ABC transporter permease [Vannielia litorea]
MKLALLCALVALAFIAALALGDQPVPPGEVIGALFGAEDVPTPSRIIVTELRLPRAVTALLVGAALAVAGTLAQAVMRNPLADPGIVGINAGAALAAMVVIVQVGSLPETALPWLTFAGALAMAVLIYAFAWRQGTTGTRIILVGIGLSALAGAGASAISVFGEPAYVQRAMVWLAGSLQDSRWEKLPHLLGWSLPPALLAWAAARELDLIALGDDVAQGRGQPVNLARALAILACAMLSGAAVAAAGLVAFVGLAAPHIARALTGPRHARLIPAAAFVGAALLLTADIAARRTAPPLQLPVGLVTALLGAPFFAFLLWNRRND